ncbi:MAG: nitrogen fixation protein NifQ [Zoogloea sp.]|uniref:nitrogen fixation protein NifQ n=1 Tax=Zoogloea sp. TaxID=49181 RepID=UPI003F3C612A
MGTLANLDLQLLAAASDPSDVTTLALAGVIASAGLRPDEYQAPVAGIGVEEFSWLLESEFPYLDWDVHLDLRAAQKRAAQPGNSIDEFSDLLALLWDHRVEDDTRSLWVACAVSTACMGANHLWQDMGLPSRHLLGELLATHFPSLHALNNQDMKWKKFFYKQLCDRAEIHACRAPSCAVCNDKPVCFGPEEGLPLAAMAPQGLALHA